MTCRALLLSSLFLLGLGVRLPGEEAVIGPGARIESLTVGPTTYRNVQVRSVNARTVLITHSGGMASIHLRDLAPEWQARFHYDAAAEAAADQAASAAPPPAPSVLRTRPGAPAKGASKFEALLLKFGQPAVVQPEVDLRPVFFNLELGVKNQGQRPSCAVFAIVSALEFQNAMLTGKVEKFSEEYLIWAVRKTTKRLPPPTPTLPDPNGKEFHDEGFALSEVVAALRAYGIPLQTSMPYTFGTKNETPEDPSPAIVQEARNHQRVFVQQVPGRDRPTLLNNIVQALNSGFPVAVGMAWPMARVVNGYLSTQKPPPDSGHAVTLVGYKCPTSHIEDAYFIFKNSWGPKWGQGGYGTVTYDYLSANLDEAILLEVQAGG